MEKFKLWHLVIVLMITFSLGSLATSLMISQLKTKVECNTEESVIAEKRLEWVMECANKDEGNVIYPVRLKKCVEVYDGVFENGSD